MTLTGLSRNVKKKISYKVNGSANPSNICHTWPLSDSKFSEYYSEFFVQKDIIGLYVAMDVSQGMDMLEINALRKFRRIVPISIDKIDQRTVCFKAQKKEGRRAILDNANQLCQKW